MEKKWLCDCRTAQSLMIVMVVALFVFTSAFGENAKEVEVAVEIEMNQDNRADALDRAQQRAFRDAVREVFTPLLTEEELKKRLSQPAEYIKSYRLLEQEVADGILKASYICQVIVLEQDALQDGEGWEERFAIEAQFQPQLENFSLVELTRYLQEETSASVQGMRLQYGSLWLELRSSNPERTYRQLRNKFRQGARFRLVEEVNDYLDSESNMTRP